MFSRNSFIYAAAWTLATGHFTELHSLWDWGLGKQKGSSTESYCNMKRRGIASCGIFSHSEKAGVIMPKPCSIVFWSESRTFYHGRVIPYFPRSGFVYLNVAAEWHFNSRVPHVCCLWWEHSTTFSLRAPSSSLYLINAELQLPAPDGSSVLSPLSNFYGKNEFNSEPAVWILCILDEDVGIRP